MKNAAYRSLFGKALLAMLVPLIAMTVLVVFLVEYFVAGNLGPGAKTTVWVLRIGSLVCVAICAGYCVVMSRKTAMTIWRFLQYGMALKRGEYAPPSMEGMSSGLFGEFALSMGEVFSLLYTVQYGLFPTLGDVEKGLQNIHHNLEPLLGRFQNQARSCRVCGETVQDARDGFDFAAACVSTSLSHIHCMEDAVQEAQRTLKALQQNVQSLEKEAQITTEIIKAREETSMQTHILSILSNVGAETKESDVQEILEVIAREMKGLSDESLQSALGAKMQLDAINAAVFAGTEAVRGMAKALESIVYHVRQSENDMNILEQKICGQATLTDKTSDRLDAVAQEILHSQENLQTLSQSSLDILRIIQQMNIEKARFVSRP